jgi:hypothetical protein
MENIKKGYDRFPENMGKKCQEIFSSQIPILNPVLT